MNWRKPNLWRFKDWIVGDGLMLKVLMPSLNQLINADYKAVKTPETEALIKQSLQGLVPSAQPELRQISGIPGSGKSTFCAAHLPQNFLFLSFDKIMVSLPAYQRDLALFGNVVAFKNHEMTARIIGYELLRRAVNLHLNIMFEHSGTNAAHLELFKNIRRKGYRTAVDFIVCDTKLAINRAAERAKKINRFVPEQLILERAAGLKQYAAAYQKLTPSVTFFDGANNFRPLKKI